MKDCPDVHLLCLETGFIWWFIEGVLFCFLSCILKEILVCCFCLVQLLGDFHAGLQVHTRFIWNLSNHLCIYHSFPLDFKLLPGQDSCVIYPCSHLSPHRKQCPITEPGRGTKGWGTQRTSFSLPRGKSFTEIENRSHQFQINFIRFQELFYWPKLDYSFILFFPPFVKCQYMAWQQKS